jgi:hypothetical protein
LNHVATSQSRIGGRASELNLDYHHTLRVGRQSKLAGDIGLELVYGDAY